MNHRLIMHIFMSSTFSAFNDPLLCRQGTNLLEKGGQNRRHYIFIKLVLSSKQKSTYLVFIFTFSSANTCTCLTFVLLYNDL